MSVPSISTGRFELVSMSLPFMQHLVARDLAAAERELGASLPADFPDGLEEFLRFRIADLSADPGMQPWLGRVIVLTEADGALRCIGSVGFHAPPDPDGRVEIGYGVEPAFRRQGIALEAVRAMLDWARSQGVLRFRAAVAPDNVPSLAIVALLGFRRVGVQVDDIDGIEAVFELDDLPSTG